MCQACIPADDYDCDSDLEFHSDNECPCPHDHAHDQDQDHKEPHAHHEHGHSHEHSHGHDHENQHNHNHNHNHREIISDEDNNEDTSSHETVSFPSDPFFARLITASRQFKDQIVINDSAQGLQLTYAQFLQDVQALRVKIRAAVPADLLDANGTFKQGAGYVGVLAEIQYPFFVASLAVLSLGGVIVPMGHAPEADQAFAIMEESRAIALLFDPTQSDLATGIESEAKSEGKSTLQLPIEINLAQKSPGEQKFRFVTDDNLVIPADRPALLLFGGGDEPDVLTRQAFYDRATGEATAVPPEMRDAMMLCILICLSSGPPPS
ncbi:hypothetical protein BO70DRAFT_393936 [Aspergillus heteromorphus CBS 117.55]|uniref:Uncharacterized protein n=1 Tax=Aspergillus heteromorphus CBS 117.55 TaxID=1448321 RepID=A0A317WP82_9EURO|nr:uncharacterized protein BO70DRAFT_393936 [Aspergillus heteromorphus CBS 117.55]PWY88213.1 hypothetical protein BO70DRAFT_393936 [Aspergillus heteromorphus CBS 117.55]